MMITAPPGSLIVTWTGPATSAYRATGDPAQVPYPDGDPDQPRGVAAFTRRGDSIATGWLDTYQRCTKHG
ncbi:hypothetical protein [Micromonospora sp. LOL_024]|uniref:hypothetical protein n=1 Tax=Micromonospora sp. LOL_024 TaxID=3345412 RepID=UPI003A8B4142